MLNIKEAVARAKSYASDFFIDDKITDILLEEVDLDDRDGNWKITVSFLRPQLGPSSVESGQSAFLGKMLGQRRIFKVVYVNAQTGELSKIVHREAGLAA